MDRRRRLTPLLVTAVLALAASTSVVEIWSASAATAGCRVEYQVTNQWQGGFGGQVTVVNLGDPVNGWTLTWSFGAGQTVTQAWNATVTQSGAAVTARNVSYNASIATGAQVGFGFNGSWTGDNPSPVSFALNGVTCTGTPVPTSGTPTSATPTSATPTSATPTSATPTSSSPPGTPPASYPNPGRVTGDTGAHDPAVIRTPSGGYLLAVTGDGIGLKTSTDRTAWRNAGAAFPNGTPWADAYTAGSRTLWAPDLAYRNNQYYMYYSASTFGSSRSAIFLATSPSGASGSWTNRGLVVETTSSSNYNAIDPNLVVDAQGQWWLGFGSFWSGLKLIRLDNATGLRSGTDTAIRSIAARPSAGGAIEAAFVHRHGGYYYLFASFDTCCRGASSTYRVMVGRSTSVTGPYLDRNGTSMLNGGGTQVLAGHGSVHGPGHEAVISDNDGDVLFYHYYADDGTPLLGINLLGWDAAGWPFVH